MPLLCGIFYFNSFSLFNCNCNYLGGIEQSWRPGTDAAADDHMGVINRMHTRGVFGEEAFTGRIQAYIGSGNAPLTSVSMTCKHKIAILMILHPKAKILGIVVKQYAVAVRIP